MEDAVGKEKLPWMDRRVKWARLCLPLAKSEAKYASKSPLDKDIMPYKVQVTQRDFDLPQSVLRDKEIAFHKARQGERLGIPKGDRPKKELPEPKVPVAQAEPTSSGWIPFRVRTNAVFGHVLHSSDAVPESIGSLLKSHRTFSPLIPPIDEMSLPGWVPYRIPSNLDSYLVLRFKPFTDDPAVPQDPFAPHLELRLKASTEDVIEIDCLHAVCHTHVADICLPSEFVDARITQRIAAKLPGRLLDMTDGLGPLTQFLRDSIINIPQANLYTPPRLTNIGLPRWMFYRPEVDLKSPFLGQVVLDSLKGKKKKAKGGNLPYTTAKGEKPPPPYEEQLRDASFNANRHASYLFAGLEVHRPVSTTFDGWRLTYTSIEAGQGGGRRAELSLLGMPGPDQELRRGPEHVDSTSFLRSVYILAHGAPGHLVQRPGDSEGEGLRTRIGWFSAAK